MLSALRKRFTYTNVAMTLALVFAMTGGAYAASKFVITSTKQIKPSVLKQLQGKAGKAGANGANGAQGPQGPAGANGKDGVNGTNGKDGAPGANGESVTVAKASVGECKEGGSKFSNATGSGKACNGSPWTAGGTLPSGKSEKGTWAVVVGSKAGFAGVEGFGQISTSFNIPLSAALTTTGCATQPTQPTTCQAHLINKGGMELVPNIPEAGEVKVVAQRAPAPCPGNTGAPSAEPGNLCVYIQEGETNITNMRPWEESLVSPGGAVMTFISPDEGAVVSGDWAVTAE
jgi:hypothetical protein